MTVDCGGFASCINAEMEGNIRECEGDSSCLKMNASTTEIAPCHGSTACFLSTFDEITGSAECYGNGAVCGSLKCFIFQHVTSS